MKEKKSKLGRSEIAGNLSKITGNQDKAFKNGREAIN